MVLMHNSNTLDKEVNMTNIKQKIIDNKVIGIIRGVEKNKVLQTVESLLNGGIELIEITLNHQSKEKYLDTIDMISMVNEEYEGKIYLGAGTVISEKQVEEVISVGAEYIISPNTDIEIINKTKELNKISIPGAYTPTEVLKAYHSGADFVKLFPASTLGTKYVKSILSPVSIPILAVGGINMSNIIEFIRAGVVGVGIGGSLIDKQAINQGKFDILTEKAKKYLEIVRRFEEENKYV